MGRPSAVPLAAPAPQDSRGLPCPCWGRTGHSGKPFRNDLNVVSLAWVPKTLGRN